MTKYKCPECKNISLEFEKTTHGHGEYKVTVITEFCPCGYGDASVS